MLSGTEVHRLSLTLGIALLAVSMVLPACARFSAATSAAAPILTLPTGL